MNEVIWQKGYDNSQFNKEKKRDLHLNEKKYDRCKTDLKGKV
jgi:hypothetical protein